MADIKPMVDHIARQLAGPLSWDQNLLSGPAKAAAMAQATHLLADAPVLYDALEMDKLRADLVTARATVAELVRNETDPCQFDHNGDCQMHNWTGCNYMCPLAKARELVADLLDGE